MIDTRTIFAKDMYPGMVLAPRQYKEGSLFTARKWKEGASAFWFDFVIAVVPLGPMKEFDGVPGCDPSSYVKIEVFSIADDGRVIFSSKTVYDYTPQEVLAGI